MTRRKYGVLIVSHPLSPLYLPVVTIGISLLDSNATFEEGDVATIVVALSGPTASPIEFEVAGGSFSATGGFGMTTAPEQRLYSVPLPDEEGIALDPPQVMSLTLTVTEPIGNPGLVIDPDTLNIPIQDNDCEYVFDG